MEAVVVDAVLEARASQCSDADRARAALNEALLAARAPTHGGGRPHGGRPSRDEPDEGAHWTVTMSVAPAASGFKAVEAVIVDDAGTVVAQRTLTDRNARTCLPLARAVGAWASLVLDAEMNRAQDDDAPARPRAAAAAARPQPAAELDKGGSVADSAPEPKAAASTTAIEIGTMVYLRDGLMTTGEVAGLSPFVTVELTPSWVLRPALFFGRSTGPVTAYSGDDGSVLSHLGARTDICRRIPGNYMERRGIEADLCAGVEAGIVTPTTVVNQKAGRASAGPAVSMRGELGGGVALELRGLLGANLVQYASVATPLVLASAELGASVRFR